MQQSFIKLHENDNGDIVITYIGDAKPMEEVEPQSLVIERDDAEKIAEMLVEFYGGEDG